MVCCCSYPLIVSIETHCGVKQQQTMAFYMQQVFGDKLYVQTIQQLPSPEVLRKKIIIKVCFSSYTCNDDFRPLHVMMTSYACCDDAPCLHF